MAYFLTVIKKNSDSDYTFYRHAFKKALRRDEMARDLKDIFKDGGATNCTVVTHSKASDCRVDGTVHFETRCEKRSNNDFFQSVLCFTNTYNVFMDYLYNDENTEEVAEKASRCEKWHFEYFNDAYDPRYENDDYVEEIEYADDEWEEWEEEEEEDDDWDDEDEDDD